jgi:hypothetical protein
MSGHHSVLLASFPVTIIGRLAAALLVAAALLAAATLLRAMLVLAIIVLCVLLSALPLATLALTALLTALLAALILVRHDTLANDLDRVTIGYACFAEYRTRWRLCVSTD